MRYIYVVAIECNIRSSALARKSTSAAIQPFLVMFISYVCASFMDETTESLSSQAVIDMHGPMLLICKKP